VHSVDTAHVQVLGEPQQYSGRPISILDEVGRFTFSVNSQNIVASSTFAWAAPDVSVFLPPPVPRYMIAGAQNQSVQYTLLDSVTGSVVYVTGGSQADVLLIPRLGNHTGTVYWDGGGQGDDANEISVVVDGADGREVILSPFSAIQKGGSSQQQQQQQQQEYMVHHTNTPRRRFYLNPLPSQVMNVSYMNVEENALVEVFVKAAADGATLHHVLGCNNQAELRLYIDGPGQHLILVGDGSGTLVNFGRCTVRIFGSNEPDQDARIVLLQDRASNFLHHVFNTNYYAVRDPLGNYLLQIAYQGIKRIILNGGTNSNVNFVAGTRSTETILNFPPSPPGLPNEVTFASWTNAILLNGSVSRITVGPSAHISYSVEPFSKGEAILALAPVGPTEIRLESGQDQPGLLAPVQRYQVDALCLNPLDEQLAVPPLATPATAGFVADALLPNGFRVDQLECHLAYVGGSDIHFAIFTGSGADYLIGRDSNAQVSFTAGKNDDLVLWTRSAPNADLHADLGEGRDKLSFDLPTGGNVNVTLGPDGQVDSIDLFVASMRTPALRSDHQAQTASATPISAAGHSFFASRYEGLWDRIHVRAGALRVPVTRAKTLPGDNGVVYVDASAVGETLLVDIQSDTTYVVTSLGLEATLVLDPVGTDPTAPPARNWQVELQLPDYSQQSYVFLPGRIGLETLLRVQLNAASQPPVEDGLPVTLVQQGLPGFLQSSFGAVRVQSVGIDHIDLNSQTVPLDLTVDGTATADLRVFTAVAGTKVSSGATRFVNNSVLILGPASISLTEAALRSNATIIALDSVLTALQAGFAKRTHYEAGGVRFEPPLHAAKSYSDWFLQQLAATQAPAWATNGTYSVITWHNQAVHIQGAPSVYVSELGAPRGTGALRVSAGDVTVFDTQLWISANLSESLLEVENAELRYTIEFDQGHVMDLRVGWQNGSNILVVCADPPEARHPDLLHMQLPPTVWRLQGTLQSALTWATATCTGLLPFQHPLPTLVISNTSRADVNLTLTPDTAGDPSRFLSIDGPLITMGVASPEEAYLDLSFENVSSIGMRIDLIGGNSSISFVSTELLPVISLDQAAAAVVSAPIDTPVRFPNYRLGSSNWKEEVFELLPAPGEVGCLNPPVDCTPEAWVALAVEKNRCSERECPVVNASIVLETSHEIQCPAFGAYSPDRFALGVNQVDMPVNRYYRTWTKWLAVALLILGVVIPTLFWLLETYSPLVWAEILLLATLAPLHHSTESLPTLSFLLSLHRGYRELFELDCLHPTRMQIALWVFLAFVFVVALISFTAFFFARRKMPSWIWKPEVRTHYALYRHMDDEDDGSPSSKAAAQDEEEQVDPPRSSMGWIVELLLRIAEAISLFFVAPVAAAQLKGTEVNPVVWSTALPAILCLFLPLIPLSLRVHLRLLRDFAGGLRASVTPIVLAVLHLLQLCLVIWMLHDPNNVLPYVTVVVFMFCRLHVTVYNPATSELLLPVVRIVLANLERGRSNLLEWALLPCLLIWVVFGFVIFGLLWKLGFTALIVLIFFWISLALLTGIVFVFRVWTTK
jgi:hypothetical protein